MMAGAMLLAGCGGLETGQTEGGVVDGEAGDPPPYFVALAHARSSSPFCGGTLIEDDIVLTAAHCVRGDRTFLRVTFPSGSRDRSYRWASRSVDAMVVHDDYRLVGDAAKDVALLLLDRPAPSRSDGRKVSTIWRAGSTPTSGEVTIMGYGNATNFGWLRADAFQTASASVLSACPYEGALCLDGGDSATTGSGDSGGPVVRRRLTGHRLVGIVSGGDDDVGFYAPVADLEDWIDTKIELLRKSVAGADMDEIAPIIDAHCYDHPFDLLESGDAGWARTRIDDTALTRALVEVDRATYEAPHEELMKGAWIEDEGCSMRLADDTFIHRALAFHPALQLVRLRAYIHPRDGEKRYFEVLGKAAMIPSINATAADQTWLSLNMASSTGWLVEPSGVSFQVQPRGDLEVAPAAPASSRAIFRVGEIELRLHEHDGQSYAWWSSPRMGSVEAPVAIVASSGAGDGGISVAVSLDDGRVTVEVENARSDELVAWELSCRSGAPGDDLTFGPYLPEAHPEVARVPAGTSVQVMTDVALEGALPADLACELNGIEVPLELR